MYQRSELDWIYNDTLAYAELIFDGDLKKYLEVAGEHKLLD